MDQTQEDAAQRLAEIGQKMVAAQNRFGPTVPPCQLVAVSKTVPAEKIAPFLVAGQMVYGENRVQEARDKWPGLRANFPSVQLHLIGPLQTNKTRDAVELFDCIQTLDREKLAASLRHEMDRAGRHIKYFVQVNVGQEAQKSGVTPAETVAFVHLCQQKYGLDVVGLMCIPPDGVPAGPYFALLAELGHKAGVSQLSMGMSADFVTAIAMGASAVRVGSALFGARG